MDENTRTHKRMPEYKRIRTKNASMGVVDVIELLARRGADLEAVDVHFLNISCDSSIQTVCLARLAKLSSLDSKCNFNIAACLS